MCYYMEFVAAVQGMDLSIDKGFEGHATDTIFFAFTLMDIQENYARKKTEVKDEAVQAGLDPTPGSAAMAAYWTGLYNVYDNEGQAATQTWQSMVQGNQSTISNDFDEKAANFSALEGLGNGIGKCIGLVATVA